METGKKTRVDPSKFKKTDPRHAGSFAIVTNKDETITITFHGGKTVTQPNWHWEFFISGLKSHMKSRGLLQRRWSVAS
jgi:hypothetical protein